GPWRPPRAPAASVAPPTATPVPWMARKAKRPLPSAAGLPSPRRAEETVGERQVTLGLRGSRGGRLGRDARAHVADLRASPAKSRRRGGPRGGRGDGAGAVGAGRGLAPVPRANRPRLASHAG